MLNLNKHFSFLFILLLLFNFQSFSQSNVSALTSDTRNFDQKNIKLNLQFNWDKKEVIGTAKITFSPLEDNFNLLTLHARTMKVSLVKIDSTQLKYSQDDQNLYIKMDKNYSKGTDVTVNIEYSARPTRGFYFFMPTKENPDMPMEIWSQGQSNFNRYWYPAYDLPDDKLTSEIVATVPENLIAVSNGELISVKENPSEKTKTFDWKMDHVHSNYLTTLIVGDYATVKEKVQGVQLDYNLPKKWINQIDLFYGRTPQMMMFFSNYIVPYPYSRYAQTTVQDFEWGGMENVTSTTLNRRLLHGKNAVPNYSADELIAHEMAHQWFGDYLTCKNWKHDWLNEGFATYFTDLWTENQFGEDEFRYLRYNENNIYLNEEVISAPLEKIKKDSSGIIPVELGGSKAYERGAAILNMLRFELGNNEFQKAIRYYVNKFKNDNVVTEDLRNAFQESTGKDLSRFFNEWIYGAGYPEFEVSYNYDDQNKKLILVVKQTQKELPAVGVFHTKIPVQIIADNKIIDSTIQITGRENNFSFDVEQKPDMIRFNKNFVVLCKVEFNKLLDELAYQLQYDDDVTGRIIAADEISKFGKDAVPFLRRTIMRDTFYGVRIKAVESLKKIGGEVAYKPLIIAADDFDGRVREAAVKALSIFSSEIVGDFLVQKFNEEKNDYVKGAAAYSIGSVKMNDAFEFLKKALEYDSHRNIIRRKIFDGLKELGDPKALPLVSEYTQYKYSHGGMHLLDIAALDCAKSFDKEHHQEVINVVAGALKNPYFRTINHAAALLAELGAKEKLPDLKEVLKNDKRQTVQLQVIAAIKKLENR